MTRTRTREEFERHFWSQVEKTSTCWLWTGTKSGSGYGYIMWCGRQFRVHRLAYEIEFGPIPDGLFVCHHCDVKLCVRPDHLFHGTCADNEADKIAKGRQAKGERNGQAKLTSRQIRWIRKAYATGLASQEKLGDRFGVSQAHIWRVVHRLTWNHLS